MRIFNRQSKAVLPPILSLVLLLATLILGLACGGGGGGGAPNSQGVNTVGGGAQTQGRFKASFKPADLYRIQDGDELVIVELNGQNTVIFSEVLNLATVDSIVVDFDPELSYSFVIKRKGISFLSTVILSNQIKSALQTRVLNVGFLNSGTTLLSHFLDVEMQASGVSAQVAANTLFTKYFNGTVSEFAGLSIQNLKSNAVEKTEAFYADVGNRVNALSVFAEILTEVNNDVAKSTSGLVLNGLYQTILKSNDITEWNLRATEVSQVKNLPQTDAQGLNLVDKLESQQRFFDIPNKGLLTPPQIKEVFYEPRAALDNLVFDVVVETPDSFISGRILGEGATNASVYLTYKRNGKDYSEVTTSDANGNFTFNELLAGDYQVQAVNKGFYYKPVGVTQNRIREKTVQIGVIIKGYVLSDDLPNFVDNQSIELPTSTKKLQIKDNGVATSKIADAAVTTAKIADASVVNAKLGAASVTSDKLASNLNLNGSIDIFGNLRVTGNAQFYLPNAQIMVGNANNVAQPVGVKGDVVLANDGTITVTKVSGNSIQLGGDLRSQGNVYFTGSSNLEIITAGDTKITLPTQGTVATLSNSETLTNKTLNSVVINGSVSGTAVLNENDLASNSATQLATQKSIKAYIDSRDSAIFVNPTVTGNIGVGQNISVTNDVSSKSLTVSSNIKLNGTQISKIINTNLLGADAESIATAPAIREYVSQTVGSSANLSLKGGSLVADANVKFIGKDIFLNAPSNAANIFFRNNGDVAMMANVLAVGANTTTLATRQSTIGANTTSLATNLSTVGSNTTTLTTRQATIGANTATLATNLSTVGGNTTVLVSRQSTIGANTTTLATNLSTVGGNTTTLASRQTTIGANTTSLAVGLSTVGGNTGVLATNLATVGGNTTTLASRQLTIGGNTTTLASRQATIGANTTTLATGLSTVGGNTTTLSTNITALRGNVITLTSNVSKFSTNVATLSTNISFLYGVVGGVTVSTIGANTTTNKTNISTVGANTTTLAGNVSALIAADSTVLTSANTWAASNVTALKNWTSSNVSALKIWGSANVNALKTWATSNVQNSVTTANAFTTGNVSALKTWVTSNTQIAAANTLTSANALSSANVLALQSWVSSNVDTLKTWTSANVNALKTWTTSNVQLAFSGINGAADNLNLTGNINTDGNVTFSGAYDTIMVVGAATNVSLPATGTLVARDSTDTLTNKTLVEPTITGNATISSNLAVTDDVTISDNLVVQGNLIVGDMTFPAADGNSGEYLKTDGAGTLTWGALSGAADNLTLKGNIITGGNVTFTGAFDTTLTVAADSSLALPSSGTLATLTGTETFENKTLLNPTLTGNATFSENVAVTGNLYVAGNIIPNATGTASGNLDVGTETLPFRTIFVQDVVMTSDERKKKDIEDVGYGLEDVMKLRPVKYNWKGRNNEKKTIGLLAQEVNGVIKEVVNVGKDEKKSMGVNYPNLIPVLIKAIQEQNDLLKRQEARILELENKVDQSAGSK